jgi:hypothetical protein
MSFIDQIPAHKKSIETKLLGVNGELAGLNMQLEGQEEAAEFAGHDCDCDYCPSREFENFKALDDEEITELETKRDDLIGLRDEYNHTLISLDSYAKLWGVKV